MALAKKPLAGLLRLLVVVTGLGMLVEAGRDAWHRRGEDPYAT